MLSKENVANSQILLLLLKASHKNYMNIFTVTSLLNEKRLPTITRIITHTLKIARQSKCGLKYEYAKSAESVGSAKSVASANP